MHDAATESKTERAGRAALSYWIAVMAAVLLFELAFRIWVQPWPYYRGWNWSHVDSGPFAEDAAPGPFFANVRYTGDCYGDLAFVADVPGLRAVRPQVFTTDGYGYRNPPGRELGPWHVLALGDSMMAGAGLTDADGFTVQLEALLGQSVYNAAGPIISEVLGESRLRANPPRYVLVESIERYLLPNEGTLGLGKLAPPSASWPTPPAPLTAPAERIVRARWSPAFSAATHYGSLLVAGLRWRLFDTVEDEDCVVGTDGHTLFSLEEMTHGVPSPEQLRFDLIAASIASLRDWFATFDVQLVYVLVPDKATLYRELVPPRFAANLQPAGAQIRDLQRRFDELGVAYVDLHAAFLAAREESSLALYWSDDTHWSPRGTRVAAQATAARLADLPHH